MSSLGSQWKRFVISISSSSQPDVGKLSESAIHLLASCPVARPAVMDLFCSAIDDYMFAYTRKETSAIYSDQLYKQGFELSLLNVLKKIVSVLTAEMPSDCQLVTMSAPSAQSSGPGFVIYTCQWALQVLGQMSRKYGTLATSFMANNASTNVMDNLGSTSDNSNKSGSLEELLKWWLQCPVMKEILKVAELCLECASVKKDVMTCLLNAAAQYTPQFDWVMAHLASQHIAGIFQRVLLCTVIEFNISGSNNHEIINKFHSALSVLSHLGGQHTGQLKIALSDLIEQNLQLRCLNANYKSSLPTEASLTEKENVLPPENAKNLILFLLMLASTTNSSQQEGIRSLIVELIACVLDRNHPRQIMDYFNKQQFTLREFREFEYRAVSIILNSTELATGRILQYLMMHSCQSRTQRADNVTRDSFQTACYRFLKLLCKRMVMQLHSAQSLSSSANQKPAGSTTRNQSAANNSATLCMPEAASLPEPNNCFLLEQMRSGSISASRLVLCRIQCHPPGISLQMILNEILSHGAVRRCIWYFFHILNEVELNQPTALDSAVQDCLKNIKTSALQHQVSRLKRLIQLVQFEARHFHMRRRMANVLNKRVDELLSMLYLSPSLAPIACVVELYESSVSLSSYRPYLHQCMSMAKSLINAIVFTIRYSAQSRHTAQLTKRLNNILLKLSNIFPLVRSVAIRVLVQELANENAQDNIPIVDDLTQNLLINNPPQSASSGRILKRKRPSPQKCPIFKPSILKSVDSSDQVTAFRDRSRDEPINVSGMRQSCSQRWLSIVQSLLQHSSNSFNGGMSPRAVLGAALQEVLMSSNEKCLKLDGKSPILVEEVTQLYKKFQENPVLWNLLELMCSEEPPPTSGSTCLALIRSLLLALNFYWTSSNCARRELKCSSNKSEMKCSLPLSVALDDSFNVSNAFKESLIDPLSREFRDTCFLYSCLRKARALPARLLQSIDCLLPHLCVYEMYLLLGETHRILLGSPPNSGVYTNGDSGKERDPIWSLVHAMQLNHIRDRRLSEIYSDFLPDVNHS